MTCTVLSETADEEGTYPVGFSMTGTADEAVTPNSVSWTLTDIEGNVINSRLDQVETPAEETWIILEGDDLADSSTNRRRILTIKGTFNSTLGGTPIINKPYTEECSFNICPRLNIPNPP